MKLKGFMSVKIMSEKWLIYIIWLYDEKKIENPYKI